MKLPCALVVTALSAALLINPVVSISNDAAAADSAVDLMTAADQSANSDQHEQQQHEQQRELWPYFKKE